LGSDHLANNDSSGINQVLNGRCRVAGWRIEPVPSSVAVASSQTLDIVNILNADSYTSKWLVGGFLIVEAGWYSNGLFLANCAGWEYRVGAVSIGNGRFCECSLDIRKQSPRLVYLTSGIDEVGSRS
jgi:hypothetical protein